MKKLLLGISLIGSIGLQAQSWPWNPDFDSDGGIGAVGVWDRVLTAEEVSTVFNEYIPGCTDVTACNYDSAADVDNGTCEFGCNYCGDGTEWNAALNECIAIGSVCGTGFTWNVEQESCVPIEEICGPGTEWNSYSQTCVPDVTCISDLNLDGVVGSSDLLIMLAAFGLSCELSVDITSETCETTLEYDNYTYDIVSIGEQCWFAENLRSTHYANGDVIPNSMTAEEWASTTSGACAILWENTTNPILEGHQDTLDWALQTFGRLYNFYAVTDPRTVCPSGWHVSTDSDWFELETYLGLPEEELLLNNSPTRGSAIGLGHKLKDSQAWVSPSLGYDCDDIQTNGTWLNTDYLTSDTRVYGLPVLNLLGTGRRIDEYFGWGYNSFVWSPDGEQPVWRYTLGHWDGMARAEPENAFNQGNPVRCVKD